VRIEPVIIDTGPLVAYIDKSQAQHGWMRGLDLSGAAPWLTCETVIAEAWYLLRKAPWLQDVLLDMISGGALSIDFSLAGDIASIRWLRRKYRDVPMSLADACLVTMAQAYDRAVLLTFDSDFSVYRTVEGEAVTVLKP
jgi:predicted nucleic acid-binding protein